MTDPVCGMTVEPKTAAAAWEHVEPWLDPAERYS